jgi:hypothetical protein
MKLTIKHCRSYDVHAKRFVEVLADFSYKEIVLKKQFCFNSQNL